MSGVIRKVFGARARFCDDGCRDSFRCDREHGLIYSAVWDKAPSQDGKPLSAEAASIKWEWCCYCNKALGTTELESIDPSQPTPWDKSTNLESVGNHPCPTCRADNEIVNQCGCDPSNMPTGV